VFSRVRFLLFVTPPSESAASTAVAPHQSEERLESRRASGEERERETAVCLYSIPINDFRFRSLSRGVSVLLLISDPL